MVEDEFRFGNIPAVMFVNVKGMKKVVRKGAVCLDNTFAGGGCLPSVIVNHISASDVDTLVAALIDNFRGSFFIFSKKWLVICFKLFEKF